MTATTRDDPDWCPFVSVIVPLHQGERYITSTLDSLHRQSDDDLEVIVVDDGSTDDGRALVESHPVGARLLSQANRGVAAARNRGAAAARGAWLAFLDQDDLWHRERLERVRPFLESTTSGFVSTTMRCVALTEERADLSRADELIISMVDHWVEGETGLSSLSRESSYYDDSAPGASGHANLDDVLAGTLSTTTSFFVRADHLRLIGGWSMHARSIDDWWLMASSAYLEPIARLDDPGHLYRLHPGATSRSTNFWYAYSSSLTAIRLGGNFVDRERALRTPIENDMAEHMLGRMVESDQWREVDGAASYSRHMAAILWPGRSLGSRVARARLKRAAPWLVSMRDRLAGRTRDRRDPTGQK